MKIALVHSFYASKTPSGENIVVLSQMAALRDAGYDVKLIEVETDELNRSRLYPIRAAMNVASGGGISPLKDLKAFRPDIVHVHNLFPNFSTNWLQQWTGPVIATQHNYRPMCAAGTLLRDLEFCSLCPDHGSKHAVLNACYRDSRLASLPLAIRNRNGVAGDVLLSRADRVVLLSERSKDIYTNAGLSQERTAVIPNFVSDEGFSPTSPAGKDWIFIGRLTAEKGVERLIERWPNERSLRIYGDGPLRQRLSRMAPENVVFEGGIERRQVPGILSKSRGLIFPSLCVEGAVPLTYVEALAAGRPVVAYTGNGASDDINQSQAGEVFADWSDIPAALQRIEDDEKNYALRARDRYEKVFTRESWLEATSSLYTSVLAKSKP
ncbi:glycosyltransferase family 4 protein [Arthrobacter nitrophenolicus]|uniref:glycosyltransferase family 4 protein n=1 Tax=Arthrobacter nitrophenolicus TaxID=683150 RepID=UPI00389A76A0